VTRVGTLLAVLAAAIPASGLAPPRFADAHHERKTTEVRTKILGDPGLVSVPIAWSSGIILSTRPRT
jgi:hypothetical protein